MAANHLTRARDPGDDDQLLADLLLVDVLSFGQFGRACTRATNRRLWRRYCARRASALAVTLRRLERLLGEQFAGRKKSGGTWIMTLRDSRGDLLDVIHVRTPAAHRLRDFVERHVEVVVVRPDLALLLGFDSKGAAAMSRWRIVRP
jgi:hypothetical protein